jgi:hypothetical protein
MQGTDEQVAHNTISGDEDLSQDQTPEGSEEEEVVDVFSLASAPKGSDDNATAKIVSHASISYQAGEDLWQTIANFEQLQAVFALNIQGNVLESPSHIGRLDEETEVIIPQLTKLNLYGCVTVNSQPYGKFVSPLTNSWAIQRPYLCCWLRSEEAFAFIATLREIDERYAVTCVDDEVMTPETFGLKHFILDNGAIAGYKTLTITGEGEVWVEDYHHCLPMTENNYVDEQIRLNIVGEKMTLITIVSDQQNNDIFDDCVKAMAKVVYHREWP